MAALKSDTTAAVINLINVLNFFGIAATVIAVWFAYNALEEQRLATAWSLISQGKDETGAGNTGLIAALKVLRTHNQSLYQVRLPGAYLSGIDLPEVDLQKAEINRANLSRANLRSAKLGGADLRYADLRAADLSYTDLSGATLDNADLSGAKLDSADLRGASMRGARLFRTDLRHAKLETADLTDANLNAALLTEAGIDGARLDRADMRGANLKGANFGRAILYKTDLRRADLRGAILKNADIEGGVQFQNACREATDDPLSNVSEFTRDTGWCGPPEESYAHPPPSRSNRTVYYLIPTLVDEWQTESQKVIQHLFSALGYDVVSINANDDPALQNRQLAEVQALKPDIIIINALDADVIDREAIAKARRARTRVLVYDRLIPGVRADFTSITDAVETGKRAAQSAVDLLTKQGVQGDVSGKILQILGDPADNWSRDVQVGFEKGIRKSLPSIDILSLPAMKWDPDNARLSAYEQLKDNNDLKLIFAHAAELSVAVVQALKENKKKKGDILLMSGNGAPAGLKNIEDGWQQAEIDEPVYAQVYAMALFLDDVMNGRPLAARSCSVLNVRGALVLDPTVGPIFKLSSELINASNVQDPKFWGNLIPPKEDRPSACQ
jgi:ribose transport system substrate-binding protein